MNKTLHSPFDPQQGALAFWDYAAAAPHVAIDMNPAGGPDFAKVRLTRKIV